MSRSNRQFISLILFFLALIFPFYLHSQAQEQRPLRGKALYEKITKDRNLIKFEGLSQVNWTQDGLAYFLFEEDTFKRVDAETGEKTPLFEDSRIIDAYNRVTGKQADKLPFKQVSFLDGGKKIRFLALNRTFIYDLEKGEMNSYSPQKQVAGVRGRVYSEVFSPDLRYRAFIRDFNLFIRDLEDNETALTAGGHTDLRNGFPDWVYPEELNQYEAFWWSPDSAKIAYMQFDEGPVRQYPIIHDINPIPSLELMRYPKAGENNPIVRLFIVDIKTKKAVQVEAGLETNVYLFRGQWTKDGKEFTYQRLNRWQNKLELLAADQETGKTRLILMDEDKCYLEADFDLRFLKDDRHFLWTSERTGWKEIYLCDLSGKLRKQLTSAKLPVGSILAVDEEGGWVYFTGFEQRGLESHVYRVRLDGTGFTRLTKEPGTHAANFAPGAKYFIDSFTSFSEPRRVSLHRADGLLVRELGKSVISQEFKDFNLLAPEHFLIKSADGKFDLDAILFKPAHFSEEEKYPLIFSVYGGPGSRRIANRFLLNDSSQALAQLGFLVLAADHRGVSRRGKIFQNLMYLNLGEIELEDHVAAVKQISLRPYVDSTRVGIFGHSYGGYLTCLALLKAPDVFQVGVAGAPVTDWRNYDTIYTERYMRRPQDNLEGYEKGSCLTYAKDLKGKLFIHHGAVDDNVHPGNTIQLIHELLKHNKAFDLMIYPEQDHGIRFERYAESRVEYFIQQLKPEVK